MGKKPAEVVSDTHTINTMIDFKVTKADIIDMVLQEEEDRLDTQINACQEALRKLQDEKNTYHIECEKKVHEQFNKKYASFIKLLKGAPIIHEDTDFDSYILHREHNKFKITGFDDQFVVPYTNCITKRYKTKNGTVQLSLNLKPKKKEIIASLNIEDKMRKIESEIRDYKFEKGNLSKKGSRARSKIVADLLSKSEVGSQILAKVKGMKSLMKA